MARWQRLDNKRGLATKRAFAAAEMMLILPAVLFMTALFMRNVQPLRFEPAHTAQEIVAWYAARPRLGLWLLLITLPLAVLTTGCAALLRNWHDDADLRAAAQQTLTVLRAHLATLVIAMATLTAAGILAIVALHSLSYQAGALSSSCPTAVR